MLNKINHIHFDSIGSTNTWAKMHMAEFPKDELTIVTAEQQTEGRGRYKNKWHSPKGNLYASFCFFTKYTQALNNIAQFMALILAEILEKMTFKPMLKWPNDILICNKKCAGILSEISYSDDRSMVIVGIGVNVNSMPADQNILATSLYAECGSQFCVNSILVMLQKAFLKNLAVLLTEGFFPFLKSYRDRMAYCIGLKIKFKNQVSIFNGTVASIEEDGSLNLLLETGELKNFSAGIFLEN